MHDLGVRGPVPDEVGAVETLDLVASDTTGHDRYVVDIGLLGHRRHRGSDVPSDELGLHVGIEDRTEVRHRLGFSQCPQGG
jgi:hypothetical protein